MRRFVLGLFAAIGILTVLGIIGIGLAAWRLSVAKPALPDRIVLEADLTQGLADGPSQDALTTLVFGGKPSLRDFLDALDRAAGDSRVKGIYARIGGDTLGLATVQQVRDAVRAFRAKGKFAIAFSESLGEFGPGTRPYYLAAGFQQICLQPLGSVGLVGLRSEVPFVRGTLDKIGVTATFSHREQYKTAANSLTEPAMTPPQREEVEDLLDNSMSQIVAGIAADRKLSQQQVHSLIDRGPFTVGEAAAAGLIDRVAHEDEVRDEARRKAGAGAKLVPLRRYLRAAGRPHDSGPEIALIYGAGLITSGDGQSNPLLGEAELSARKLVRAFRKAAADKDVRAILFRIDSPGGSATASEAIWRAVAEARKHGKPVIVSMGDVAGSGGYYIAAPADKIVAEPATLTGSIGVLAGKLVVAGLLQKIGMTEEWVQRGTNAGMFSMFEDFSPAAHARLEAFLDMTYKGFKARVAAGRHLSTDQVEAVAKGRVWTGEEAKAKGLVDELGGYEVALRLAKEAAKIPTGKPFKLVVFPKQKSTLEELYDRLEGKTDTGAATLMRPFAALAAAAQYLAGSPVSLRMPRIGELR